MQQSIIYMAICMLGLFIADHTPVKGWSTTWIICYGSVLTVIAQALSK